MGIVKEDLGLISGGGEMTEVEVVNGRIQMTSSTTHTFAKDYKYVIAETYGGGTNAKSYRLNGTIEPYSTASGAGSQNSATNPTDLALFKDVKSGDILSLASGSLLTTIIGLN